MLFSPFPSKTVTNFFVLDWWFTGVSSVLKCLAVNVWFVIEKFRSHLKSDKNCVPKRILGSSFGSDVMMNDACENFWLKFLISVIQKSSSNSPKIWIGVFVCETKRTSVFLGSRLRFRLLSICWNSAREIRLFLLPVSTRASIDFKSGENRTLMWGRFVLLISRKVFLLRLSVLQRDRHSWFGIWLQSKLLKSRFSWSVLNEKDLLDWSDSKSESLTLWTELWVVDLWLVSLVFLDDWCTFLGCCIKFMKCT